MSSQPPLNDPEYIMSKKHIIVYLIISKHEQPDDHCNLFTKLLYMSPNPQPPPDPQIQTPSTLSNAITQDQSLSKKQACDNSICQRFVNRTFFCHSYNHMVKKYLYCAETIASALFLGQVEVLEFDSSGGEYKSNHHEITVSIPSGAIPQGETVHMEVAVALYGPFQFSDGKRPISPILWLCPQEDIIFQKPVTIVLPHMLTGVYSKDIDSFGIQFAKADHTDYRVTTAGEKEFVFKPYKSAVALSKASDGKHYAILRADHCCFWCLEMNKLNRMTPDIARHVAQKMGYFIHCVECLQSPYCSISPPRDVIHFCVSFMLDTCTKVSENMYIHTSNQRYGMDMNGIFHDQAIEDQFPVTNAKGELIHKIHTQRFNLNEPHLQLQYATDDKDLCDVAVSNEGKVKKI